MPAARGGSRWGLLRALAGDEVAAMLVERFGGRNVVIPRTVRGEHWLTRVLGEEAMRKVVHELEGARVYVPQRSLPRSERNRQLRSDSRSGASAASLAARYGLSQRQVRNILTG